LKARSDTFMVGSLEHVTSYHYLWGCVPGTALRMYLPPSHPIRMALSVHFYRTHSTCMSAKFSLLDEVGILGRILPFTYEKGLKAIYEKMIDDFVYKSYPEELEDKGMGNCEFHAGSTDGVALHKVLTDYISNLFDEVYGTEERLHSDDGMREVYNYIKDRFNQGIPDQTNKGVPEEFTLANVKSLWGEILFRVTGAHNVIGNAAAYAKNPLLVNFRLTGEQKGEVVGSYEVVSGIAAITGLTLPNEYQRLRDDWKQVLDNPESDAYATLHKDLEKLGKEIDERNKIRVENGRFVNRDFHPDVCPTSIFG